MDIEPGKVYVSLPNMHKIKLTAIEDHPLSFEYHIMDDDVINEESDEEVKVEKQFEETKGEEQELKLLSTKAKQLVPGDLIVNLDKNGKPALNISQRLMVEFTLDPLMATSGVSTLFLSKGFQFDVCIHTFIGQAAIESIDGTVEYTEAGERNFTKKSLQMAKPGDTVLCKLTLDTPIGVDNFENTPSIAQVLGKKDGKYIGSGHIVKHVPLRPK